MKKSGTIFLLTIVIIFRAVGFGYTFENLRNMDVQSAAMGFVKNNVYQGQNDGFVVDSVYSELFGVGLKYYAQKVGWISPRAKIVCGVESLLDQDPIDNIGYSEKATFIQINFKTTNFFRMGTSLKHENYLLAGNNIGNGWVNTLEFATTPQACRFGSYDLGISIGRRMRTFSNGRVERRPVETELYMRLMKNGSKFAVNISKNECHFGTEYQLSNNISLRAGLNGKEPTFGLGIKLNRLRIDYAYWLSEAGVTQLLGSNFSF